MRGRSALGQVAELVRRNGWKNITERVAILLVVAGLVVGLLLLTGQNDGKVFYNILPNPGQ
ncbi:MAG: hypothetical protein M3082_19200 [Candidatus Dormibacteraeota bacterium]|nr:hypothetical protein [Candidatus Dormibacteraeota bacterium]